MTPSDLQSRIDRVDGFYTALQRQKSDVENEILTLKGDCDILLKTSTVLKHLLDSLVKDDISKMAGLVTYGLKTIFEDQNLSFMPTVTKKNEKLWIELKTINKGIEGEFGSFGGSVAAIEGFLLRIIWMLKLRLARLIVLDETFAHVSEEYISNTSKLLKELSKKLNLDILLVTHQHGLKEYADNIYRVVETPMGIIMEKEK